MKSFAVATAAAWTLTGAVLAAPSYNAQSRSVFVSTDTATDSVATAADDFGLLDVDVFASSSVGLASFSHATRLGYDAIVGSFAATLSAQSTAATTGGTEVVVDFSLDTPTGYTLTLFDQTNVGTSEGIPNGALFTSRVRLLSATDTKFSLISRSINEGGATYSPAGEFVGDFDQDSQSAAGILDPGDYRFLFTVDISTEEADLNFGLHPLILAFESTDGGEAVVPLPASAWAGLGTLGLLATRAWQKRQRPATIIAGRKR